MIVPALLFWIVTLPAVVSGVTSRVMAGPPEKLLRLVAIRPPLLVVVDGVVT